MHKLNNNQAGYSLIQIAIGMVVLGIFIATAGNAYVIYKKRQEVKVTTVNMEIVRKALQGYRERLGHYPCVASMIAERDDADYGVETDCTVTTVVPGDCDDGYCVLQAPDGSNYIMTNNVTTTPAARALANPRVRVGAVPFRLLQIDENATIDGNGSRMIYAVTESLTDPSTFSELDGAIHLVNAEGESLVTPDGSAPYVLVSPGHNGLGAYTRDGAQQSPCSGVTLDAQNCFNFDPSALVTPPTLPTTPPLAVFAYEYRNDGDTTDSFDDMVEFFSKESTPKWQRTSNNVEDIKALISEGVGVGSSTVDDALYIRQETVNYDHDNNPGTAAQVHRGALRVTGTTRTDEICDEDGTNCFTPDLLAGAPDAITCNNPGEYMVGISGGAAICEPVRIYCTNDAQPILAGVNADGSPRCIARPLAACNANVQLCSGTPRVANPRNSNQTPITNPIAATANHGQTILVTDMTSYAPNRRRANFSCSNGVLTYLGTGVAGLCSCTPPANTDTYTEYSACPGQSPSGNARTRTVTWNAANCAWTYSGYDYTQCLCPGPTTPQPANVPLTCPSGTNSGDRYTTYSFNAAQNVCNWVGSTVNNCTCTPPAVTTRTLTTPVACSSVPGFSTFTGNAYRIQTFNSTTGVCTWQDTGWDTSQCACDTTTEYPAASPASACTSCERMQTASVWRYRYQLVSGICSPGAPYEVTPEVCVADNFYWRATSAVSTNTNPASSPGTRPGLGDTCSCEEKNSGNERSCYESTDAGIFFYNCRCTK